MFWVSPRCLVAIRDRCQSAGFLGQLGSRARAEGGEGLFGVLKKTPAASDNANILLKVCVCVHVCVYACVRARGCARLRALDR